MKEYLVFDIGGTAVKYAILDENAKLLEKNNFPTPNSKHVLFDELSVITDKFRNRINGIAISSPGVVDSNTGLIAGDSAIPYIHEEDFNLKNFFNELGFEIEIENDANCAALAEVWKGNASESKDALFVILGTGIGGAVIKDKKIHRGKNLSGGEFGYMISSYSDNYTLWGVEHSTIGLVRQVAKRKNVDIKELTGKQVFEMAEDGDIICQEEIDYFYKSVAVGLHNLAQFYDPEIILIGGAISSRDDLIEQLTNKLIEIHTKIERNMVIPKLKKCKFSGDANLIGALYHYYQQNGLVK